MTFFYKTHTKKLSMKYLFKRECSDLRKLEQIVLLYKAAFLLWQENNH